MYLLPCFLLPVREGGGGGHFVQFSQQALLKRGIVELLLTSDNTNEVLKGHIKGGTNLD